MRMNSNSNETSLWRVIRYEYRNIYQLMVLIYALIATATISIGYESCGSMCFWIALRNHMTCCCIKYVSHSSRGGSRAVRCFVSCTFCVILLQQRDCACFYYLLKQSNKQASTTASTTHYYHCNHHHLHHL